MKKLFTFLFALTASIGVINAQSGTCGDNLTWELSSRTLTISGTGAMADYASFSSVPWYSSRSAIKTVLINDGVTSIGKSAFRGCSSLTSVTIPNGVTSIGSSAFWGCSSLTSITIPNSVTSIGDYAFNGCKSLTSVAISNSVTSIGEKAFDGCASLTSITIPNSVISIRESAFLHCDSLTSINVDSNNPNYSSVDGVLFNKDKTTLIAYPGGNTRSEYTIPNSVTSIGVWAFGYCSSLTNVTIPNSVTSIGETAFQGCSSLTSITIPNSVTSIGSCAFWSCKSLTSVTIPNNVTSIGERAFQVCDSLTSINVDSNNPNYSSVDGVLFNKDKTTLVAYPGGKQGAYTIPNSVTSIGEQAFRDNSSLTSVTIGNSVTSIGEFAFYYCIALTSVTIGNSVTSIGIQAFYGCSSLTSVTFESITPPIIKKVFYNTNNCPIYVPCGTKDAYVTALNENNTIDESRVIEKTFIASGYCGADSTNLTWELSCDSILTISGTGEMVDWNYGEQNYAPWSDYSNFVVTVILPDGLTHIGHSAFSECSKLQNINIPNTVTSVGEYALTESSNPLLPIINGIRYADTYLVAPINNNLSSYVIEEGTKWIGTHAFYTVAISSITIPNSVIGIGSGSFIYTDLTEITIPNSVETIGNSAFYDCNHLKDVIIGSGVKWIGHSAFSDCNSLSSITCKAVIPPVLEEARVFRYTSKTIPLYVPAKSIDAYKAAEEWKEFINILPIEEDPAQCLIDSGYCGADSTNLTWELSCDGVLTISGTGAMADYAYASKTPWYGHRSAIKIVLINDGVTSIGEDAFGGCDALTYITIPNSVTSIGDAAFYGCSSLTSVTIPNSVTSIGSSAFYECSSLTSISIPNSVTSIGNYTFYGCQSLTSINVDSNHPNYSSVDGVLFNKDKTTLIQCPGGKQGAYTIPNSVTSIGNSAFSGCSSLTSVIIPNSVTSIGDAAFNGCSSLTSVTFESITPLIIDKTLNYTTNNCLFYVPCGTKDAYVAALNVNNTIDQSRVIEKSPYTYSIASSDSTLGSVIIIQEPTCTAPLIFRADAAEGYQFTQWSDGNTDNPRSLILTQDTILKALFEQIVIEQDTIGAPSVKPVTSTEGYDFYVAFMPNGASKPMDKDLKLQLFVNSREANRVRLEYADGSTKDYNVPAGGTTTIDVDPKKVYWDEEKLEEETILDKGVRVYSLDKKPMTVYSGNQNGDGGTSSFDGAHVLPKEALGQEYVIQSANDDNIATEFVVMSTRPGTTTVTVELNVKSRKGNKDRLTITFRKAKQIYIIRSKSIDPNQPNDVIDLSGSTICANAPVAVWSGNQSAIIPNQAGMTQDHAYDQLLPVNRWGQEFIVPMTGMKMQMNELHIISLKESTNVTVSGVGASGVRTKAMGALEKWKKVVEAPSGENLLDSVFTITADKPIQVYLYTSSAASNIYTENGLRHFQGDPSMTMISPLEFVTDTTIFSTYETGDKTSKHQLVLWAKQSVLGSLQMNGAAIGGQLTQTVPGMPEYRFARIDVTPGTYTLTAAERGFGGYVYGLGEGQAYLYPAGYTFKPYQDSLSLNDPNQEYPVFRSEWNENYLNDGGWYLDKEEQKDGTYILDSIRVCDSTELTFPIKMYNEWDHVKWEIIGSIQGKNYFTPVEQYSTETSKPELTHQFLLLPENKDKSHFEDFAVRAVVYHKPIMCDNIKQENWPKDTLNTTVRVFSACIPYQDTIIVADSTGISDIIPDGQDTIPYIEVQPDGEITIDITDVRIGVITIVTIGTESGQVHPGFGGNYDNLKNTRVVMEYVLNPFGQTASPDKWYAFAVPFKVDIETGITRKYGNKSHVPGKDFMILEYDSELRSRTGSGWKEKKSGLLEPGHFYMLGIEGNCNRWLFEKVRNADVVGDKEKDLQHYAHGNSKNNGWHGLGNTTLEYVDMSFDGLNATYVYTYDNQYGRYNIYSIEESILAVGQPFFTQGDNDGSVAFTPNNGKGKGNGKKNMPIYAPSYDVQPSHPRVLLTIETEKINATPDRLYITLHDDNQCGSYRIGRDFMRMDKGSKQVPNFWCPMADGTQLSAHGVTMPTTYTTIPLGIFTPAKGEYTINAYMQDMDDYIVELYCQNVCLGIVMQGVPFRLEMAAGTSYEYSIRISRRVSTDLNPAEDTQCDKDNKWYDVLGRPLPQDAHGIFIRKGEKIIK